MELNIDILENRVIFEDKDVLVLDKPVGFLVHNTEHSDEQTVADWFVARVPEAKGVGEEMVTGTGKVLERSGVVHRLDRGTSGVLVLAKNQTAYEELKKLFQDREVEKEYRAFVYGQMKSEDGSIRNPIGRSKRDPRLRSAEFGASGQLRSAVTNWQLLEQGEYQKQKYAYLALLPETGRTHQLRVHLKAIGRPIVGDELYEPQLVKGNNNLGFERLALHAYRLTLDFKGQKKEFIAPLPEVFTTAKNHIASQA